MAKCYNIVYKNLEQILLFIEEHQIHQATSILIQGFFGTTTEEEANLIKEDLLSLLPQAFMIGCSSNGQILNDSIIYDQPIFSFTIFEHSKVKVKLIESANRLQLKERGTRYGEELIRDSAKAMILLSSHVDVPIQSFLDGVHTVAPKIHLAGGISSNRLVDFQSFVLTNEGSSTNAIAIVSLEGEQLTVVPVVNEQWQEVGQTFYITKRTNEVIYEINGQKAIKVIRQYLGDHFVQRLPGSATEFPFIFQRSGKKIALFITEVLRTGAIKMNASFDDTTSFRFAFADLEKIASKSIKDLKKINKKKVEALYLFNCVTRIEKIEHFTRHEVGLMNQISPVAGFFSHGEIGKSQNGPQIFFHSLTYLAISESVEVSDNEFKSFTYSHPSEANTIVSLTHLINASADDIQELNDNIQISEDYFRSLFDNNHDLIFSTDLEGRFTSANRAFMKTFGFETKDVIGKSALSFVKEEDASVIKSNYLRTLSGHEQVYDLAVKLGDSRDRLFEIRNIAITVNEECVGVFGIARNVTDQRKVEEKITQLAYYDSETGLANRTKFLENVEEMIRRAKKKRKKMAILFIDLDRFKMINDSLGHFAGDFVLKEFANRIQSVLPKGAYVGRFGSDKFTVLLTKETNEHRAKLIANQILSTSQKPFLYQAQEFFSSASIGISLYPLDGNEGTMLLKNADIAHNTAKVGGGNQAAFYSTEMNKKMKRRVEMESHLRKALERDELFIVYQPLINLSDQRLVGFESLLRWKHPEWGIISPAEFIPLAEETGIIDSIGKWVLIHACIHIKSWHDRGYHDCSIAVNVSANQFKNGDFITDVKEALKISGLPPEHLHLELTESVMLNHSFSTIETIQKLSNQGVKIAIDDFGTGYSSLSYLKHLPIHILKIDQSFVQNMSENTPDSAIVQAVTMLAHGMGLEVVAEGVETKEQLHILQNLGCDVAQGYFIKRPMDEDTMSDWMTSNSHYVNEIVALKRDR
jgi:diguanylate cyclase (GGDEF)-like protein/PAS domain S-box-containing protein